VSKEWDGVISRRINRKFSRPLARFLASYTRITPNHVTITSFMVGCLSGISFFFHQPIIGGLFAQFSSILDGADGDLAVLTGRKSLFGGFLDSVLDRYSDAFILIGMTYHVFTDYGQTIEILFIAICALFGSFMVSYSRARAESNLKKMFESGFSRYAASRDVRLFVIMIGGVLNQILASLLVLAVLTNLVVLKRLHECKKLAGE